MKKVKRIFFTIVAAALILFAAFLIYATISDYTPPPESLIEKSPEGEYTPLKTDSSGLKISILSWNIGYCGLNKEMDFFYSGGKQVYPSEKVVENNIKGVEKILQENSDVDFVLLQEVDRNSTRSYHRDEMEEFSKAMPDFQHFYAPNYRVFFVPVPLKKPMGAVESGLVTFTRHKPVSVVRHSFKGNYAWPKSLFMLDRCFMEAKFMLSNGKSLVLINTHNSAYDDGTLKAAQMQQLKAFIENEYRKGNYVIVGGDWNQCPPGFKAAFSRDIMDNKSRSDIASSFMKDWKWAFDNGSPTNRRNKTAYKQGHTPTTVIDFFLLSPNIEILGVKNLDYGFNYSDHQPVKATFRLMTYGTTGD